MQADLDVAEVGLLAQFTELGVGGLEDRRIICGRRQLDKDCLDRTTKPTGKALGEHQRVGAQEDGLIERLVLEEGADRPPFACRRELSPNDRHNLLLHGGGRLGGQRAEVAVPDPCKKDAFFGHGTNFFVVIQKKLYTEAG
jgi:hypothetical protein